MPDNLIYTTHFQAIPSSDAKHCNRGCIYLQPGMQTFASRKSTVHLARKMPFPSLEDGSQWAHWPAMRHYCMGSEWVRNVHLGESEVGQSAHSSWISCTKEAVCATFPPILREEAIRMKVSKWYDFGGYCSILFTITLYDFTSVIRFFRLSVCRTAIATLKSRPAMRKWRG